MKTMIPTTRHIGEKARERKENRNSSIPLMETKVIHPMTMAKEKADMTKEHPKRSQPWQRSEKSEEHATAQVAELQEPSYAGWIDQEWDQSWNWNEQGWYSSHETSSNGQALMAFHDAYKQHEKKANHKKLIQSDTVSEHNLSATTNHSLLATKLTAPVINFQDNGCTRSMGSWHAIQRFTQAKL